MLWKKIVLSVVATVAGILLLEGALRILGAGGPAEPIVDAINELNRIHGYNSDMGWVLVPGSSGRQRLPDFDVVYRINDEGFRDDRVYPETHDTRRALLFGDSFAFGIGVSNEETFAKKSEKETGHEVLNFGVSGYDPGQYLLALKKAQLTYHADAVIFSTYLGNDIEDVLLDHLFAQPEKNKPYFVLEEGHLELRGIPVRRPEIFA
ncbi:MAG: hypothetical protein AAB495_03625 [Patescibacteria group bacterium]